jgi:3-dehydroquinate synthase
VSDTIVINSYKGPYTVNFDKNSLDELNTADPTDCHLIIDANVADLCADRLNNVLAHPSVLRIDAHEDNKSLEKMPDYIRHLVHHGIRRHHRLIAIGGGITQDITCFLAATLLRGVTWVFYPTTLLAQADSCIGSKSSINVAGAKNIVGTFTPPKEVHICEDFLDTLDEVDLRSGIGEILKVHAIDGPASFEKIANDYGRLLEERSLLNKYIRRALEIKLPYIEEDEFDTGPRNIFNYGHTFGHAIEAATDYEVPHGIGITIGMDMANYVAASTNHAKLEHFQSMHPTLKCNFAGYERTKVPMDRFIAAISKDKKNMGAGILSIIIPGEDGVLHKVQQANDSRFFRICDAYLKDKRTS